MKFGQVLFDPEPSGGGEPVVAPTPTPVNPTPTPEPKTPEQKSDVIPLATYESKVGELHKDLSGVRGKNKELEGRLTEAEKKVASYELKEKKSAAFDEAIKSLGDDFELPSAKLPTVKKLIDALPDSETLAESIAELLDTAKAPVTKPSPVRSPFSPNATPVSKEGNKPLTPVELLKLAGQDKEAFIKALQNQK